MKIKKSVSFIFACLVMVFLVLIDQFTKILVSRTIKINGPVKLIDGVFEFSYLENTGAAWGMLSGAKIFFVVIAVAFCIIIGWIYLKMPMDRKYNALRICMVMITAGAVGNMIDRVVHGYVVDFLYFSLINFPIFNVADIYVTVSCILLIILLLFVYKDKDFDFLKREKKNNSGNK